MVSFERRPHEPKTREHALCVLGREVRARRLGNRLIGIRDILHSVQFHDGFLGCLWCVERSRFADIVEIRGNRHVTPAVRIQLGLKLGFEDARDAVQYFQAYPPYHSRIVVKPGGKHLDQLHPLCNRLAEMLEADRMKFGVNLVMDFLPLLFPGLKPLGRGL